MNPVLKGSESLEAYFRALSVNYDKALIKKFRLKVFLKFTEYKEEIDSFSAGMEKEEVVELYRFALARAYADSLECLQQALVLRS